MEDNVEFATSVFSFIENTYGKDLLTSVKNKQHREVVERILNDSSNRGYTNDKTGNKIVAMLRLNP
jgi:hypothetical protein